jgi:hypothetical protein
VSRRREHGAAVREPKADDLVPRWDRRAPDDHDPGGDALTSLTLRPDDVADPQELDRDVAARRRDPCSERQADRARRRTCGRAMDHGDAPDCGNATIDALSGVTALLG